MPCDCSPACLAGTVAFSSQQRNTEGCSCDLSCRLPCSRHGQVCSNTLYLSMVRPAGTPDFSLYSLSSLAPKINPPFVLPPVRSSFLCIYNARQTNGKEIFPQALLNFFDINVSLVWSFRGLNRSASLETQFSQKLFPSALLLELYVRPQVPDHGLVWPMSTVPKKLRSLGLQTHSYPLHCAC